MSDAHIRIRANRSTGELEVEGPSSEVAEWWGKLWPELSLGTSNAEIKSPPLKRPLALIGGESGVPEVFGEFFSKFPSSLTDVDKILAAAAFAQTKDPDKTFSTKTANQLLIDQNTKVGNASECVRRLTHAKRAFVVSDGKFRVSAIGLEYLESLEAT